MNDFQKLKEELLKDPKVLAEYESLKPEMEIVRALVSARLQQNLTQEQLAQKSGVRQSNISRIENGSCSPNSDVAEARRGYGKKSAT